MHVALGFLAALVFVTTVGVGTPDRPVATSSAPRPPGAAITYDGFTADHHALVDWALALFDEAGLELAPVHFVASADYGPCQGRSGIARHRDGASEITLCGERLGPAHDWLALHELAHVFERHGLGDSHRQAFMELRGLTAWRDGDWHDRGAEHAAEIIAWGLIDRPTRPGHIDQNTCEDLLAGYVTLIGRLPLHGYTEACEG
ncbi:MAG TPA: hypothetical protein VMS74_10910 [Acidimicrobiia bacterium]|nr:hypothetical protein [Acidimicrobiia bacterium]